jgi:hypothetical protein
MIRRLSWRVRNASGRKDDEGAVSDFDGQSHALQTIAKAVQIIAVQVSFDGVATALLNTSLELSGAARGAAVLAAKGALLLGEQGFEQGLPLVAKLKPDGELKDVPMDNLVSAGLGVMLAPEHMPVAPGTVVRPIADIEFKRDVELFVVAGRQYSPALDAFVKTCRSIDWRAQFTPDTVSRVVPKAVPFEAMARRAPQQPALRLSA